MALNCDLNKRIFTFEGKDYNYNEFRSLMYDGLLERIPELTAETKEALSTEEGKADVERGLSLDEARRKLMEMRGDVGNLDKLSMAIRGKIITVVGRMTESRALAMARVISPNLKIVRYDTIEGIAKAYPGDKVPLGFYDPETEIIHIGPKGNLTHILSHEVLHPILNKLLYTDSKKLSDLYEELKTDKRLVGFVEIGKIYLKEGGEFSATSQTTAKVESLIDYLGAVADGKFDKELLGDSKFMQALKEAIFKLMELIGLSRPKVDITNVQTLKDLAKAIATASRYSRAVKYSEKNIEVNGVKGSVSKYPSSRAREISLGNVSNLYAGEDADLDGLERDRQIRAEEMEARGENPEEIRATTGWFRGKYDNQWKKEIDDSEAVLLDDWKDIPIVNEYVDAPDVRLSEVLDHKKLYEKYPEARDIKFSVRDMSSEGYFKLSDNEIAIKYNSKDSLSIILHEIQHWIQSKEGFAEGGNLKSALKYASKEILQEGLGIATKSIKYKIENAKKIKPLVDALSDVMLPGLEPNDEMMNAISKHYLLEMFERGTRENYENALSEARANNRDLNNDPKVVEARNEMEAASDNYNNYFVELFEAIGPQVSKKIGLPVDYRQVWDGSKFVTKQELGIMSRWDLKEASKYEFSEKGGVDKKIAELENNLERIGTDKEILAKELEKTPFASELYKRIAGEIESRDIEARAKMSEEERRQTAPYSSENIPKERAIFADEVVSEMRADEERVVPSEEYKKALDAAFKVIEESPERAWASLSRSEQATRMADAAVAAMKKSDWFKGQDIKQQRAAIRELRGEIADRLGVKLAPKTEKQQQRAEDAAFKLGQKLGKKEEAERNKKLIKDFAEWKAKQKAKTKAEKQALEEKYAEKFGKHRDEVKAIIKEQKKKLAEAKTNIKTAMAAANEAVSKAVAGISAARKAGEASARRKSSLEQKQMAAAVVAVINENRINGSLSFRQASMLMRAAAKVNFSNVKSIERFMDLLDKVIDDVAYANQIFNIRKKQKIARGKIPAADAARVKQFVGVNAKKIDESLLYDYEQALGDLNLKVPRLAKMDAIYSQVVIDKPKTDIDADSIKDRLDKLIDSLENLDVKDVDSYKEAIRLVNSIRRKTNEALLSEVITQAEADEILKDIPDTQEKFDKAFGSQIDAIKKGYIAQIGISAGKVDTTGMSPEVKNLVDSATSLTSEQLNDLSPFDLDLLADLLDVIASEGTVHVNMLASVVARAETAGQGQRIADQLQFAPSVKLTDGGWVRQKVRMASKRSVAFWESALGLSKVKAGAVYKFIFAEIQRASVDSDKLVNAASLEFMRLRDKYKLEPGILGGPDPMVKLGMIITYLQEYDLSNSQMAQNNPGKGYGSRDWFGKGEMDKYMGDAISTKKIKAMINFWNAMPKDENGNVSPKAVHDSFIKGNSRFLTENELGFLNELLAWKESNITPMQKFANELRGKGLDTIKYHMPRIRINSKSKEIPANKFFDSGARRITIESMSGKERKDFSVGPVETDLTKLFINNVDSVSVDYFYTQSVMKINDVLASAEKLSPDKLKAEEYVKAIRQVAADALNHEFSHAKLNKYIRRVLTVRSVGILFGPLRPLQELLTAIISIPFRTGSPAKVYGKMKDAVAEYEQWFKKNEYVLDVMERSKSAMTNRDGFNKIYEFKRDGYEKKTKFEKLAFALTSWPERTQINISWMPVFEQEFRREAGVAFDQAAYKLDPEAYFKKHKQAFLSASATADNSYQKIVGPSTQFGARKKVGVLGVDVETNSNAGMMLSWMSNWPSRSWWQLKDATTGFVMAEREARLTGYAVGDVRTDAASQALGVANETLVYSFLTNLRLIYGKAMATTIGVLAASVAGDDDDDDEELSRVWDEANKEAMAGFAPSNLIQGGANSVISLATSPSGAVGREIYGLTVNLLLTAAENKSLGMDKQDAKFLREYMEKYMFKYDAMNMSNRYAGEDAVQKALYNTLPALSGAVSQVYAVADAYNIVIPSMMKKIENGEELTLNEKEVYALLSLTINSANLYGMLAGGVALPFGQDASRMMKDLQKKHPGGQGLLLDRIPSEFIVE